MRLINTVSIAIALATATSLAAPSASKCAYESDKVHISCSHAEQYPRDVEVTYNMAKRSDVELFLRRSDALEAMARGMDEEIALQERGAITGGNNNVGNVCNFGNGNVGKRQAAFGCDQEGHPLYGPHPQPVVLGAQNLKNLPSKRDGNLFVHSASGVPVTITNSGAHNTDEGQGNNVDQVVNFGMGRRGFTAVDRNGSLYVTNTGGVNPPMTISANGNNMHITAERRDTVGTVSGKGNNLQNKCVYGNQGKRKRQNAQMECVQTQSPIYGPNGGSVTIIGARSFSLENIDDIVSYHAARSLLPNASPFVARQEVCSGVPVGPVGAQVTYVTRGLPTEPTPVAAQKVARSVSTPSASKPQKRCINTPIPPVAPTVTYESKAQYEAKLKGQ